MAKKTRTVGPSENVKAAISNILYMQSEGEPKGIQTVFENALKYAPELTKEFFGNLLPLLREAKNTLEAEGKGSDVESETDD